MGTVLFAWELGGGLGHVGPMKVLAEALTTLGHRVVFAVKDIASSRIVLGKRWPVLQAPNEANSRNLNVTGAGTYADIMAVRGFADAEVLESKALAWIDLLQHVRPGLLIADHSPTALLAGYGIVPTVTVGYGFYLPPSQHPIFPAFRDGVPPVVSERSILDAIKTVQARLGRPAPETVPKLFAGLYSHCYSISELDPYAEYRVIQGLGPIEEIPVLREMSDKPSLFAYLAGEHPRMQSIATALGGLKVPVQAYIRNAPDVLLRFMIRSGITVHEQPPPLARILSEATTILSHGGGGITHAALLAGRSQILVPRHIEAELTSKRLQKLGVGTEVDASAEPHDMQYALSDAMFDEDRRATALHVAHQLRGRLAPSSLGDLADVCNEVLIGARPNDLRGTNHDTDGQVTT